MDLEPKEYETEPIPPDPESIAIRIRYRSTLGDQFRAGIFVGRRSDVMFGLGLALLIAAVGSLLIRNVVGLTATLIASVLLLTGAFWLPFVWWAARQRPELVGVEMETVIDERGLADTAPRYETRLDWSVIRDVSENRDAFYLRSGAGYGFLPKRAFSESDLAAFRRLIAERGLVHRPRRRRRALIGIAVPLVIVALAVVPIAINRLTASPRLELSPSVDVRTVTVHASTDIPDGALVAIQIIQLDEYARSITAGGPATVDSPWVRQAYRGVSGGSVDATFDASGWPAGRARAVAYFNLWLQPDDVVERYGSRGERLSGPFVEDDPEVGRELKVSTDFTLP